MLREIDEHKLLSKYARLFYRSDEDINNEDIIKNNLIKLLDWDKSGDNGLGFYCGKFENIKRKDWEFLINFIKSNSQTIKSIGLDDNVKLEEFKLIKTELEKKEEKIKQHFIDENYKVKRKSAKPCIYEGKTYKSRQECMYKEGLTKAQLYKYLIDTKQLDKNSNLAKLYERNNNN